MDDEEEGEMYLAQMIQEGRQVLEIWKLLSRQSANCVPWHCLATSL